jgi:hypothetical protein
MDHNKDKVTPNLPEASLASWPDASALAEHVIGVTRGAWRMDGPGRAAAAVHGQKRPVRRQAGPNAADSLDAALQAAELLAQMFDYRRADAALDPGSPVVQPTGRQPSVQMRRIAGASAENDASYHGVGNRRRS